MAWDKNELAVIGLTMLSVTAMTALGKISETSYMLVITGICTYAFGRIFNHAQGKER